jgi:hypothetical protein
MVYGNDINTTEENPTTQYIRTAIKNLYIFEIL